MNDSQTPPPTDPAPQAQPRTQHWLWVWFWRCALVLSLPLVWYCFYVPSNDIAWVDSYQAAQVQAADSGKPMLLFVTGAWCVPCRIMKRQVWADDQVAAAVNAGYVPVLVDVAAPDAADVLNRYRVGVTPTTIITDPQGRVRLQVEGGIGQADFLDLLATLDP